MKIERFEDIEAWKAARELVKSVNAATRSSAFHEDPDLRRQMRRAARSTMANIAEGFDAGSDAEFIRFLKIARRSGSEVQSDLYVSLDEKFIDKNKFSDLYGMTRKVKELIGGFLRYLNENKRTRRGDVGRRT